MLTNHQANRGQTNAAPRYQSLAPSLDPVRRMARFGPIQPMAQKRGWLERILFS